MTGNIGGLLPAAAAIALAASACGGSNPGSGTRTLFVTALARSDGSTDGTFMLVQVQEGRAQGPLVSDAVVTVRGDKTGEMTLPWEAASYFGFAFGSYLKRGLLWDTGWWLEVKRGDDGLEAYIEAPGLTSITDPASSTTFRTHDGKPLMLRWKDGESRRAQIVDVSFERSDFGWSFGEDRWEYAVDPSRLVPTSTEHVTVSRRNEVDLAGGTPESSFTALTEHRISFAVE